MVPALASLDAFLSRLPEGRALTRRVRRHLHAFRSLAVVGPAEAARAVVLRLAETFPQRQVHLLAVDPQRRAVAARTEEALAWSETDAEVGACLRSFLRQDPDVIAAAALPASELDLAMRAVETGHLVVFAAPAASLDAFAALFPAPTPPLHVLLLDAEGKLVDLLRCEQGAWISEPDVPPPAPAPPRLPLPRRAPPPARSAQAGATWIPETRAGVLGPHRIAARSALLPPGGWPLCSACGSAKQHVVQLSGAELPELLRRSAHVVQLFVCPRGCDLAGEAGPTLAAHAPSGLVETPCPAEGEAGLGGGVVAWIERREDPHPEDAPGTTAEDDEEVPWPWGCDKLGGWPRWEQGPAWPEHGGERMELLFQVAEEGAYTPGAPPRWDDERAEELPGTRPAPRLDPQAPVHLPGLLSGGDGRGFVFRSRHDPAVLRFVWQTS